MSYITLGRGSPCTPREVQLARRPYSVRLSGNEHHDIAIAADGGGVTVGKYVRDAALACAGRSPTPYRQKRDRLSVAVALAANALGRLSDRTTEGLIITELREIRTTLTALSDWRTRP